VDADGALDRQRMREHVFAHPESRQALESIIHPLVGAEVRRQALAARTPCLVFDVPLLVESRHWRHQLDRVVVVDCLESTQLRRVRERSGWDEATTLAVIRNQSPRQRRIAAADIVLFNDGNNMEQLQGVVAQLARHLGL
jgi:dephospho-CoA kinase